jgi:hypothetical protein
VARRIQVEEGYSDDDLVELLPAGEADAALLVEGASVITVGGRDLEDGEPVLDEGAEQAEPVSDAPQAPEPSEDDA